MTQFLLILIASGVAVMTGVLVVRHLDRSTREASRVTYEATFPRGLDVRAVEAFVRALAGLRQPRWQRLLSGPAVVWEIEADAAAVRYRLTIEAGSVEYVTAQLRGAIPSVRLTRVDRNATRPDLSAELRLSNLGRQLRVESPHTSAAAFLAALRPLGRGEHLSVQCVISPCGSPAVSEARSGQAQPVDPLSALLSVVRGRGQQAPRTKPERDKQVGPHFACSLRLAVSAPSVDRQRQLLRRLLAAFHVMNGPGVGFRRRHLPSVVVSPWVADARSSLTAPVVYVNAAELAVLLATPLGDVQVSGLELGSARQLPPPAGLPADGPRFAISNHHDSQRALTYGPRSLPYHAWVIGSTGSGKSTLLLNLIADYMRLGVTVVVLDTKTDLVRDAVELIPEHRVSDLVLIDPSDTHPVGLNFLAGAAGDADRLADQMVGTFVRLWGAGAVGPRSQDILRACFQTLATVPGATLVELPLLLLDEAYRRRVVAKLDDPVVLGPQWGAFEALSDAERAQHVAPSMNKIRAVLARRPLRDVVGQSTGLDIAEVLSRSSILMVSLSKGTIGEDAASLLGSLVLLRLWQVLSARAALPPSERRPVLLVCDEFQDYMAMPLSFGDMLAQARALNVGVVAAHQHLGQLPPPLRSDLRANARSKVCFGLTAQDARVFAEEFSPHLSAADLQALGRYEVVAQLCLDGQVLAPATGVTLPPPEPTSAGERARRLSRERYGRPRSAVDAEIRARHGERPGSGAVGSRRRS